MTTKNTKDLSGAIPATYADEFKKMSKDLWKHADFQEHLLKTIKGSTDIQGEIKRLVWVAVKERIIWLIIGGILLLAGSLCTGFVTGLGEQIAQNIVEKNQNTAQ